MQAGKKTISGCYQCLKACDPRTAPYCITQALIRAVQGQVEDGLIFCGARVGELNRITTVKESDPGVRVWKTAERAAAYIANEKGSIRMKTWKITAVLTGAALVIGGIAATAWGCVKKFPARQKGRKFPRFQETKKPKPKTIP